MPKNTAKARVHFLYKRLLKHYGPQHWWPAGTAWEMMVGAILTQNTSWANVEKAISVLKKSKGLSIRAIAAMPRLRLEKLIRSSGYFRQKSKRLQLFAREMERNPEFFRQLRGEGLLPPLWGKVGMGGCRRRLRPPTSILPHRGGGSIEDLRDRLLSLHGVGPETADSILLYAGGYPSFVVDAYTRRIGQRMGLFTSDNYLEVQTFFQDRLPREPALYNEFHALIVRHAKDICTSRNPRCEACPIRRHCAHGRRKL